METRSKELPNIERKVDHFHTVATLVGFMVLIPAPMALVFGPKVLFPFGVVACIVAMVRFVNNPDNVKADSHHPDPVAASALLAEKQKESVDKQHRFEELIPGEKDSEHPIMNAEIRSDVYLEMAHR